MALGPVLRTLLYQVSPTDPLILVAVGVVTTGAGLLGCLAPARRALRVDPLVALRGET